MKYILAALLVIALAAPAGATVYPTGGTNPQNITINLSIPCYTQVYWNSAADQSIYFNDIVQNGSNGGDWYSTVLTGAYGAAPKSSQDAFAVDYYESYDNANFWLNSNCTSMMTLASNGNLWNGNHKLPTWYTIALSNNTGCTYNVDCGFISNSARLACGIIPGDGQGCYGDDTDNNNAIELAGANFYPNQHSFPMQVGVANTTNTAVFPPFAQGTILFHARVLRAGLMDSWETYTTTLAVNFSNP